MNSSLFFFGRLLIALLSCLALAGQARGADVLGVVVLHGKESHPNFMEQIIPSLTAAGFLVDAPEMPWSKRRLYDASFQQALQEVDASVDRLRKRGATKIVISGLSMGGPAVFAYGASRPNVDGLVAWAPAHDPLNDPAMRTPQFIEAVDRAQKLIADGKGDEMQSFPEINRTIFKVQATPKVWLSYWAPDGSNSMPKAAASISSPLPILIVVTPRDPFPMDEDYILRKAPSHPLSQLIKLDAPHPQVPSAAKGLTVEWLQKVLADRK